MDKTASFLIIIGTCLSGILSPGPSLTLVIDQSVSRGLSAGVWTSIGHGIGIGFYAAGSVLGLNLLFAKYHSLYVFISVFGSMYLAFLAYKLLRSGFANKKTNHEASEKTPSFAGVRCLGSGLVMAVANPKILVFFVAVFGSVVGELSHAQLLTVILGLDVLDSAWYSVIAKLCRKPSFDVFMQKHGTVVSRTLFCFLAFQSVRIMVNIL